MTIESARYVTDEFFRFVENPYSRQHIKHKDAVEKSDAIAAAIRLVHDIKRNGRAMQIYGAIPWSSLTISIYCVGVVLILLLADPGRKVLALGVWFVSLIVWSIVLFIAKELRQAKISSWEKMIHRLSDICFHLRTLQTFSGGEFLPHPTGYALILDELILEKVCNERGKTDYGEVSHGVPDMFRLQRLRTRIHYLASALVFLRHFDGDVGPMFRKAEGICDRIVESRRVLVSQLV
jgi:hypothetical protein